MILHFSPPIYFSFIIQQNTPYFYRVLSKKMFWKVTVFCL
nr:MAG TPA: hypothetical protein [Caudoviricetes sp.]